MLIKLVVNIKRRCLVCDKVSDSEAQLKELIEHFGPTLSVKEVIHTLETSERKPILTHMCEDCYKSFSENYVYEQ